MSPKRRGKSQEWAVIPSGGGDAHSQIARELQIARAVSISLLKLFEDGTYHSPTELQGLLVDVAEKLGIDEINLSSVITYLSGVLEQDDYDSLLNRALGDGVLSRLHTGENTTRQTLTTIEALIREDNTRTIRPSARGSRRT